MTTKPKEKKQDWEKEFDKLEKVSWTPGGMNVNEELPLTNTWIHDYTARKFISTILEQTREGTRRKVADEIIGLSTLAFSKKHRNYNEFIKSLQLLKNRK